MIRSMPQHGYTGDDGQDRELLVSRLNIILQECNSSEVSLGGSIALARDEVKAWRETDLGLFGRVGVTGLLLLFAEVLLLPTSAVLRQVPLDHFFVRVERAIAWAILVPVIGVVWIIGVGFLPIVQWRLPILLLWAGAQVTCFVYLVVRYFWKGPKPVPLLRTDRCTRCAVCRYALEGLPEALDSARDLGPACCPECGHT